MNNDSAPIAALILLVALLLALGHWQAADSCPGDCARISETGSN